MKEFGYKHNKMRKGMCLICDNHYKWLEKHLPSVYAKLGIPYMAGIIGAHGDKASGHKFEFEQAGIHYFHGVAIYLLTYERPFDKEVRQTDHGWVDPYKWIITNYHRFKDILPKIEE